MHEVAAIGRHFRYDPAKLFDIQTHASRAHAGEQKQAPGIQTPTTCLTALIRATINQRFT